MWGFERKLGTFNFTHSEKALWYCSIEGCKSTCKSKKAQKLHFKNIHMKQYSHYCLYCNFGRHEDSLVLSHMAKAHQAPKDHKCSICSKEFPSVQHLKRHVAICGIGKVHVCQYCEKRFIHTNNLQNHIQVTHTQKKDKYKCNLCGKVHLKVILLGALQRVLSPSKHVKWTSYCPLQPTCKHGHRGTTRSSTG